MKILLDTHMLLWALVDDNRLNEQARLLIEDRENQIYYSAASIWEMAIKHRINPERMPDPADVIRFCDDAGFLCLNVNLWHAVMTNKLKVKEGFFVSKDPFDRMLVAQAKHECMPFLTQDKSMKYYDEACILSN